MALMMKPIQSLKTDTRVFTQTRPGRKSGSSARALLFGMLRRDCDRRKGRRWLILAGAFLLTTTARIFAAQPAHPENTEMRKALAAQRKALIEAVARPDAAGAAHIF